jgi:hypothetical protein
MDECYLCGDKNDLQTHHIDGCADHNDPLNLVTLCRSCHSEVHQAGWLTVEQLIAHRKRSQLFTNPPTVNRESRLRELIYNDLIGRGRTSAVAKEWGAIAAELERVCTYKEKYTRADITAFLVHLRKRGLTQNTINKDLKVIRLLSQIQGWELPKLSMRPVSPDEIQRPILEKDQVISLILTGKRLLPPSWLSHLVLATTYGLRRIEMVRFKPIDLNLTSKTLTVHTAKGGIKTTHLVFDEIAPYLEAFQPYKEDSLTHMFHKMMVKTGFRASGGFGWHSIRRALVTELILSGTSALNVLRFMRWSDGSARGDFGMLTIYAKKDQARIDEEISTIHPFLPYWRN